MRILQLSVHLFPNVGGVETHLRDLINYLVKKNSVFILAYKPLSTKTNWKVFERSDNLTILRLPWIRGFFEKLVHAPLLEFIYLVPGIFVATPAVLLIFKPNVIHAHGLSAAVSAVFWGKLFKIRTVVSLHSIYTFPKKGLYHDFVKFLLKHADFVLSLSKKSNKEVRSLGVEDRKSQVFTYWIDLNKFKNFNLKFKVKKQLGWDGKFIVLFVGRLIREKGIDVLLESAKLWEDPIKLVIVGSGPMEGNVKAAAHIIKSIEFLGRIDQENLPKYYCAADCVIVPSTSEEGFGRVIIESLACGTPVIASKRGATDEAMDETVGKFIEPTPERIKEAIYYLYKNPQELKKRSHKSRKFVERRYSLSNVRTIIKAYTG